MHSKFFTGFIISTFLLYFSSCGKITGDFAFRSGIDSRYKKIHDIPEFENQQKVDWCFILDGDPGKSKLFVYLMKKEIVWIDVDKRVEFLAKGEKIIYGEIIGLSPGTYKIKIADNKTVISEKYFSIYTQQ